MRITNRRILHDKDRISFFFYTGKKLLFPFVLSVILYYSPINEVNIFSLFFLLYSTINFNFVVHKRSLFPINLILTTITGNQI